MKIQTRILWLLGRAADQRSRHIALHLKLDEWTVVEALQQLERAGKVKRCIIKRKGQEVTAYNLPMRAKVSSNPHNPHDDCLSTSTLKAQPLPATVVVSSGGP